MRYINVQKETDSLGNATTYTYDSSGNLISKTDANGNTIYYTYDSLDRLTKKTYPDGNIEAFQYNTKGNIIYAGNQNIAYSFTYDSNGKITGITDSNAMTISYQYDSLGNRTQMVTPEGKVIAYTYDSGNRLSQINSDTGDFTFTYDSLGRRTKLSMPNGTFTTYSYDSNSRLTNLIHKTSTGTGAVINSFDYTHDKVGNRLTKTETDLKYSYTYDAIYRLLQSLPTKLQGKDKEQENKQEAFIYDPVGNRLKGPDANDYYSHNQGNQLIYDRKYRYQYDNNGNLVSRTETDDDGDTTVWTYSYDYENRLIKVVKQEDNEIKTVTFKYDPFGRRIEKKVEEIEDGKTETKTKTYTYVYDNEDIILEYLTKTENGESKTEITRYVHGQGIDEPLAIEQKGDVYYYHADGLGSIVTLTDEKQKTVESYTYSSFGEVKRQGDKVKNTYAFTGREWDEEILLYDYRNRFYDPNTGRFTTRDPSLCLRGSPEIPYLLETRLATPQELNPYIYLQNNPQTFVDPYGLVSCFYSITGKTLNCTTESYGTLSCYAISGNNNLVDQCLENIGPIPTGNWKIGDPGTGTRAPLTPQAGTSMCGRPGPFQIHGWGTSKGCIAIYLNTCRDKVMEALRCEDGGTLRVLP